MGSECRFVAVGLFKLYLPVATIGVKSREDCGFAEQVDTFVNSWYWVQVSLDHSIELSIVDTEAESSNFLAVEHYQWCPFRLCGFDDVLV